MSSLDWLISIGLLPLSFALTGPASGAIGAQATLIGAGLLGGAVTFGALLLPGMRAVEGREAPLRRRPQGRAPAAASASRERAVHRHRPVEAGERHHARDRRGVGDDDGEPLLAAAHLLAEREQQVDARAVEVRRRRTGRRSSRPSGCVSSERSAVADLLDVRGVDLALHARDGDLVVPLVLEAGQRAHAHRPRRASRRRTTTVPSAVCWTCTLSISASIIGIPRPRCVPRARRHWPWSRMAISIVAPRPAGLDLEGLPRPGAYACSTAFAHASWQATVMS